MLQNIFEKQVSGSEAFQRNVDDFVKAWLPARAETRVGQGARGRRPSRRTSKINGLYPWVVMWYKKMVVHTIGRVTMDTVKDCLIFPPMLETVLWGNGVFL